MTISHHNVRGREKQVRQYSSPLAGERIDPMHYADL